MATGSFDGLHGSGENGQWGWFGGSDYKPNQWGYIDYTGYQCKVRGRFTITAPSNGYKINTIKLTFSIRRNGEYNVRGYLYETEPSDRTSIPSGAIASEQHWPSSGTQTDNYTWDSRSLTWDVSAKGYTSAKTLYVWFMTNTNIAGSYAEIGDGYSGSSRVSVTVTETPIATYSVTYNGNGYTGGTLPGAQTKIYNVGLTLSSNTLTHSATYPNAYKPTFNANGGSVTPTTVQQTYTRTWTHNGWRLNSASGTLYNKGGTYSTNAAATFYASWSTSDALNNITTPTATRSNSTSTRTVTFSAANSSNTPSKSTVSSTQTTTYTAKGWYTAASGGTKRCANGGSYKPTSSETVYQQWDSSTGSWTTATAATVTRNSSTSNCTITYNANGGSCSKTSDTCTRTTTYSCTGWWTQTSGGTKRVASGGTFTPAATETLYPQFTPSTGAYSSVTLPTATKTGYTFAGWSTSSTATSGTTGTYTPTGDVILYAIFSQNTYTLTVGKNGGWQGSSFSQETFSLQYNATKNFYRGFLYSYGTAGWYFPKGSFGSNMYSNMFNSTGPVRTGVFNDCALYQITSYSNESSTGTTTITYPTASSQGYTGVSYIMQIARTGATGTKANGFEGPIMKANGSYSKSNTRWVHAFYAKLPTGYYFCPTSNGLGNNNQMHWLTSNAGTGGWKMYAYERILGVGGSFAQYGYGYVAVSTSASGLTNYSGSLTFWVAFSIIFNADTRYDTYKMPNSNSGIAYQWFQPLFWTYQKLNGGTSSLANFTTHNFGVAHPVPTPTRTNYTFVNWTRIYAHNIFKQTMRYINDTSGNTFSDYKIQIYSETGSYLAAAASSSNTTVKGSWTCTLSSGYYFISFGMNGSSADLKHTERMYLQNNTTYGYYWERVNNTAGQDVTINYFIFGFEDSTAGGNYTTNSNYSLYLSANWTANALIHINANGGWLNPAGFDSGFTNDTTTPFGRINYSGSVYTHQIAYGNSADLADWNNPTWLNLIRFGYSVPTGRQYYNSAGTYFEHNTQYTAQTYVPTLTSSTPTEGDVWVNWQPNNYTFTLQGENGNTTIIETYGDIADLDQDSKNNYTFMGWFWQSSGGNYVQFGRDYMWNDKFAAHLTAYKEDWSTTDSSARLITCATSGGWSITQNSDDNCVQANVYKDGAWVRAKSNITLQSLSTGFHDFDIVFIGSAVQLYIDNVLVATTAVSAPIAYRVTGTQTTQLIVGRGATNMTSSNPHGIASSSASFEGYIGNIVIKHQNTKIDNIEARTQWNTPVHDVTLKSLFKENAYTSVSLSGIGNGIVEYGGELYHSGDTIKIYREDLDADNFNITLYPPTAKLITSYTTSGTMIPLSTMIQQSISVSTVSNLKDLSKVITITCTNDTYRNYILSATYDDIPVLRYQYLLIDNDGNHIIDDQGNNIKVVVKYIPYRYNTTTSSWQRCEPRGYQTGSWRLGG